MVIYCVFSKCKAIHQTSLYIYIYISFFIFLPVFCTGWLLIIAIY